MLKCDSCHQPLDTEAHTYDILPDDTLICWSCKMGCSPAGCTIHAAIVPHKKSDPPPDHA